MTEPIVFDRPLIGSCHCGSVKFKCTLEESQPQPRKCDCSFCDLRNAVMLSAHQDKFEILEDKGLKFYQFNTKSAKHYFCGTCGIYTFHSRRSFPEFYGVNVRCLEISPHQPEVHVFNGRQHIQDGYERVVAGILRYEDLEAAKQT